MPWSAGTYSRGYPSWAADAASNLPISASKFDTEDNDFATGLNNCLTKDGLSTPNAGMTWGLATAQVLALTRGNDGNVFSIARTGGSNNPSLSFAVTDASGITFAQNFGSLTITNATATPSAAAPNLALKSTTAAQGAFFSLTGNNGTIGTNDFALAQSGAGVGSIVNRANANLTIGTNGRTDISIAAAGGTTFTGPASNTVLTVTGSGAQIALAISGGTLGNGGLVITGGSAGTAYVAYNTQATTGSTTVSFTSTIKPGPTGGSPARWLPLLIDGTVHWVPLWTN